MVKKISVHVDVVGSDEQITLVQAAMVRLLTDVQAAGGDWPASIMREPSEPDPTTEPPAA